MAKKCRVCGEPINPQNSLLRLCGQFECRVSYANSVAEKSKKAREKKERQEHREKKEKLKTRSDWMKEAQATFNKFIRIRDQLAGHRCISSGRVLDWSGNAVDAGHYRSRGSAPHLRFDERNCHAQSKQDNRYLAGNAIDYRLGLIERIGLKEVEALEADQTPRKFGIEDLKQIIIQYKAKIKELESGRS